MDSRCRIVSSLLLIMWTCTNRGECMKYVFELHICDSLSFGYSYFFIHMLKSRLGIGATCVVYAKFIAVVYDVWGVFPCAVLYVWGLLS